MSEIFQKNKGKAVVSALILIVVVLFAVSQKDKTEAQGEAAAEKKTVSVGVKKVGDLKSVNGRIRYPATVAGDQEVKVTASVGGTATAVSFDLGDQVGAGRVLVKIDDQNNSTGENGFNSGQIQQLEKAVEIADESYDLAKDNYKENKNDATKSAKDIAKLQLENARINLESAVSGRLVKSPISGTVISRGVSTGDSVAAGQLLATISKTNKMKIQFFLDKEELKNVSLGSTVTVDNGGKEIAVKVINVSTTADAVTRRFLVEALPSANNDFFIGTVVSVSVDTKKTTNGNNSLILPLSTLTIGQNETYLFTAEEGKAKKVSVEILKISGETAEVSAELPPDALVIVEGNKLVQEGEGIEIK
ncbi:MAG: hypothetical protein A2288_00035 [Candidatus Moranbacteria bacterium RIFOXYA12_FULL_44_15]|nr:MAG: hypothetical protein A2288_00035 [Candidatus Moranbacteria bacterium RIFOXYA12_FULL_44_15]OGI35573.1 MAG: hypothetical protein A2259_00405 [Candidatus Moranbacteria bacterium RIFOXYA2_FULL_43_15]